MEEDAREPATDEYFRDLYPEWFTEVQCGFWLPDAWTDPFDVLCGSVDRMLADLGLPRNAMKAAQVKSKFGGLRFYVDFEENVERQQRRAIQALISLGEYFIHEHNYPLTTDGSIT
jgi:hypothetical protein